jgi:outer membrane protein assembly factor BamB
MDCNAQTGAWWGRACPYDAVMQRRLGVLCLWIVGVLAAACVCVPGHAQEFAVVVVDDSPTAEQMLEQAQDQAQGNPGESARLIARVLDEFGRRLVHAAGKTDQFCDARARCESLLLSEPRVLESFRSAQSSEAQRQLDAGFVRTVYETRLWTSAGLAAAMRLAQDAIDTAAFGQAQALLQSISGHPDIAAVDPTLLMTLRALAAAGLGDRERALRIAQEVRAIDTPAAREAGERLSAAIASFPRVEGAPVNPLLPGPFGIVAANVVRLWSDPLENSIAARLRDVVEGGLQTDPMPDAQSSGRLLVSVPTIVGSTVLVNEGYVLRAYDAFSMEPRWYQFIGAANAPRSDTQVGDLQIVTVAGDRVLALSGHALGNERSGGGRLVCIDLASGQRLWELGLERIATAWGLNDTFLSGAPTVVGDVVVLMGRKVTSRLETVSTAIGVDLRSGAVRWVTPLGVAPGIRAASTRPYTTPAAAGNKVFVSSGAGAVGCIDAADGRVRWVRRDQVPIRDMLVDVSPWDMGGPVLTVRGVVVIAPGSQRLQLLDSATGDEIDSVPIGRGTALEMVRCVMADPAGTKLFLIGDAVTAVDVNDLRRPLWRFRDESDEGALFAATARSPIRGRVQVGWLPDNTPALVVPLVGGTALIDGATGARLLTLPVRGPALVTVREGIVTSVGNESIEVLMDAARARSILTDSIARRPTDIDVLLGLLEFALRNKDADALRLATQRAAAAIAAASEQPDRRAHLIKSLIDAARSGLLGRDGSDALFAQLAASECSASDRALVVLAQGDFLEQSGRTEAAVAAWRLVLTSEEMSRAMVFTQGDDGALRIASSHAAVSRLREVIRRTGPLRETSPMPSNGSAGERTAWAAAQSGTAGSARGWLEAARLQFESGDSPSAAASCMSAIEASILCGQSDALLKTLRTALELLASADLQLARAQAVDRVRWCGVMPSGWDAAGELRTVPEWARWLVDGMPRSQSATATASGEAMPEAIVLEGRLVPTGIGHDQSSLHGQAFLQGEGTLVCVESSGLTERWRIERRSDGSFVIPSGMGAVVVEQPERGICSVRRVDGSGHEVWAIENLELFIAPNRAPTGAGVHPLLHGAGDLIVARYDGWVGSVRLEDGKLAWSREVGLQEVLAIDASETTIVVSGIVNTPEASKSSVLVCDRKTGERLGDFKFEDEEIRWLRAAGPNSVLFGSIRGIGRLEAVGPFNGVVWQSTAARVRATVDCQVLGPVCVTNDIADRTALTDLSTGLLQTDRFTLPDGGRPRDKRQRWVRSGDLLLTWTADGVALFALDGSLRGRSALHGERTVDGVVPQSAALLAIEQVGRAAVARGMGAPSTTQVLLHRLGWSEGARLLGPAYEVDFVQGKLDRASAMDGWLLLGGPQSTVAVSLP